MAHDDISAVKSELFSALSGHPWQTLVTVLPEADSTNNALRSMAENGAPHGTAVLALRQTGGRGRQGRSFSSPTGGMYLSLLLRPDVVLGDIGCVTPMAAVAVSDAIEALCGIRPGIKWINDLVLNDKKLCGILTELEADWVTGSMKYIIVGIGINVAHRAFPPELQQKATCLADEVTRCPSVADLAAQVIRSLHGMSLALPDGKAAWLECYKDRCITLGRSVRVIRGDSIRLGTALSLDGECGLVVRYDTGETETVTSGEVSVRGDEGYI